MSSCLEEKTIEKKFVGIVRLPFNEMNGMIIAMMNRNIRLRMISRLNRDIGGLRGRVLSIEI